MLKKLAYVQHCRVHFIFCRSQSPVTYLFYLRGPAAGCVDIFSLRCFSLSLSLSVFLSLSFYSREAFPSIFDIENLREEPDKDLW